MKLNIKRKIHRSDIELPGLHHMDRMIELADLEVHTVPEKRGVPSLNMDDRISSIIIKNVPFRHFSEFNHPNPNDDKLLYYYSVPNRWIYPDLSILKWDPESHLSRIDAGADVSGSLTHKFEDHILELIEMGTHSIIASAIGDSLKNEYLTDRKFANAIHKFFRGKLITGDLSPNSAFFYQELLTLIEKKENSTDFSEEEAMDIKYIRAKIICIKKELTDKIQALYYPVAFNSASITLYNHKNPDDLVRGLHKLLSKYPGEVTEAQQLMIYLLFALIDKYNDRDEVQLLIKHLNQI